MSYHFTSNETVENNLRTVVLEQIDNALKEIADPDSEPEDSIHQVRKRCKKIRATIRLIRPGFEEYQKYNEIIRDAANSLGSARDAQSLIESFELLLKTHVKKKKRGKYEPVLEELKKRRDRIVKNQLDQNDSLEQFQATLEKAKEEVSDWTLSENDFSTVQEGFLKTYRHAREDLKMVKSGIKTTEQFHQWRKRVKYHWYHTRLLESYSKSKLKPRRKQLRELASLLGDHHDLAILENTIKRENTLISIPTSQALLKRIKQKKGELETESIKSGQKLFKKKPEKVLKKLKLDG